MRHTQTAPAVVTLLLALGADARVGLHNIQSPNNAQFPDSVGGTKKWGIVTTGNHIYGGIDQLIWTAISAYTGTQGSCTDCIRSGQTWCSRHYLAERDTAFPVAAVTTILNALTVAAASTTAASAVDQGSCCYVNGKMQNGEAVTKTTNYGNKVTCPAKYTNDTGDVAGQTGDKTAVGGATAIALNTSASKVWWCSDGSTAKASTTLENNIITPNTIVSGVSATNPNDSAGRTDPRTEFFLINCRQRTDLCGGAALIAAPAVGTYVVRTVIAGFGYEDKCTWILETDGKGAPTFKVEKALTGNTGVMSSKYDIHYVEYSVKGTDSVALTNMVGQETLAGGSAALKLPMMSAATGFEFLKGRLYDRDTYKGYIEQPLVWQWVDATKLNTSTDTAVATYFKKRWFPVSVAEKEVADFEKMKTTYTTNTGTFNTAKGTYETAMAPKAADFFADLFNPPTATKPPLRPAMPTPLKTYDGLRLAAYANTKSYKFDGAAPTTTLQNVAANDFVVDGEMGGGWGAFTMGILNIELNMGKSFGVFGYATTDGEKSSYSQMQKHMCTDAKVGTDGFCTDTSTSLSKQILVVSLWANHPDAVDTADNGIGAKFSFTQTAWASKKAAWGAPAAPTAAVDSKTDFGAQALAASTVAAVAVASALY